MEQPSQQQQTEKQNIKLEKEETNQPGNNNSIFDKNFHYSFYLFVNPTSGGNKAAEFTKLETEQMTLHLENPKNKDSKQKYRVDLYFTNLFIPEQREKGFNKLKQEIEQGQSKCRAVVCGGDGTVMWVVEEMVKYQVNIEQCPIGIVAFGTGNDFSRVLGWGASAPGKVIGESLSGLKTLIQKWIFSQIVDFDIWDISVEVDEKIGHFKTVKKIDGKVHKNPVLEKDAQGKNIVGSDGKDKQVKFIKKHMSNYTSVGVDARIGYGFDKNRTKSQIGNKCVYAWEGIKKFFIKTSKMNDIVESLEIRNSEQQPQQQQQNGENAPIKTEEIALNKQESQLKNTLCFNSRQKEQNGKNIDKTDKRVFLKENPVCIICSNINSYGGGAMDMWRSCKNKLGVETIDKKKIPDEFENQNFGDGKLEFMSFASGIRMSLEQATSGNSLRVAQGQGPFYMNFKEKDEKGNPVKTYFQIDGEFYQAYSPKYIKFELAQALPKGKIKVMAENSSKNK